MPGHTALPGLKQLTTVHLLIHCPSWPSLDPTWSMFPFTKNLAAASTITCLQIDVRQVELHPRLEPHQAQRVRIQCSASGSLFEGNK